VPATPLGGATEPLPVTFKFKHCTSQYVHIGCGDDFIHLRIELRAVVISSTMESDDLMANDVVASLEVPGNSCRRSEVVLDEFVCDPGSRTTWSDQSTLGDLGPAKRTGSERRAVTCSEVSSARKGFKQLYPPLHGAI
jgi:hypothetical protein